LIGLSDGTSKAECIGEYSNSYSISNGNFPWMSYSLAGEHHLYQLPDEAIRPNLWYDCTNVYGCGLVMDPNDKLAIFFTVNGTLWGNF
jgi:hypothetical protein